MQLVLATQNAHKVAEFQALFDQSALDIEVIAFSGELPAETGTSFAENALIKARAAAAATGLAAIADDSGICVDVLGGAPGIFSARWSGAGANDASNRRLLLEQLSDIADPHRAASFHCEIALVVPAAVDPEGTGGELTVVGRWPGHLALDESGEHGFGYDPMFVPVGFAISAAELKPDTKNEHSHRARAFSQLVDALGEVFSD